MLLALWSAYDWDNATPPPVQDIPRGGGLGWFYNGVSAVKEEEKQEYIEEYVKPVLTSPAPINIPKPDLNKLFWDSEERKAKIADQFYIAFTRYQELEARRQAEFDDEATLLLLLN